MCASNLLARSIANILQAAHNADISISFPRGHLLNMPLFVQRRIFAKVLRHDTPLVISPWAEDLRKAKNDNALLEVCRAIRKEAVPLYYVVNSFQVQVQDFNASKVLSWWERATMHRQNAEAMPIDLAGGTDDYTSIWAEEEKMKVLKARSEESGGVLMHRLQLFKDVSTTAQGPRGGVELSVSYEPNWENLKEWLRLFHDFKLPMLMDSDIEDSKDKAQLKGVVEAFKIIQGYEYLDWELAEKSLVGIRGFLVRDDERWGDAEVEMEETSTAATAAAVSMRQVVAAAHDHVKVDNSLSSDDDFEPAQTLRTTQPTSAMSKLGTATTRPFDLSDSDSGVDQYPIKTSVSTTSPDPFFKQPVCVPAPTNRRAITTAAITHHILSKPFDYQPTSTTFSMFSTDPTKDEATHQRFEQIDETDDEEDDSEMVMDCKTVSHTGVGLLRPSLSKTPASETGPRASTGSSSKKPTSPTDSSVSKSSSFKTPAEEAQSRMSGGRMNWGGKQ
jgi:hypothetical protein